MTTVIPIFASLGNNYFRSVGVRFKKMPTPKDMTLKDRIAAAMATAMIHTPAQLARKMGVDRQTVYRWTNGHGEKLTPVMLYKLADALNANARWLAEGPPHSPVRPRHLTPEQAMVLDIYASLPKEQREEWVRMGNMLVRISSPPSATNPFPVKK